MTRIHDEFLKAYVRFKHDESGATLVEYGIAIVLAVTVGTGALIGLAGAIEGNMNDAAAAM